MSLFLKMVTAFFRLLAAFSLGVAATSAVYTFFIIPKLHDACLNPGSLMGTPGGDAIGGYAELLKKVQEGLAAKKTLEDE